MGKLKKIEAAAKLGASETKRLAARGRTGAVVTRNVAARSVVVGVPAGEIGAVGDEELLERWR